MDSLNVCSSIGVSSFSMKRQFYIDTCFASLVELNAKMYTDYYRVLKIFRHV